jgi:hypothetical protein
MIFGLSAKCATLLSFPSPGLPPPLGGGGLQKENIIRDFSCIGVWAFNGTRDEKGTKMKQTVKGRCVEGAY